MELEDSKDERAPLLMVCHFSPWGENAGVRMRLRLTFEALSSLGPVDVVVLSPESLVTGPPKGVRRFLHLKDFGLDRSVVGRVRWLLAGSAPREVEGCDFTDMREKLAEWLDPAYSMAWVARARTFSAVAPALVHMPVILDLDDLEAEKIAAQLAADRSTVFSSPSNLLRRARARKNLGAWRTFEKRQASLADLSVVCSSEDAAILGTSNVRIVPNGYQPPANPAGRPNVASAPTILMQGFMVYPPNVDAVQYFVHDVLPLVKARIPDVQVRIVGKASSRVWRLHSPPSVIVTGFVPEIEDELAKADVVAVPIRFGGGTRIKILEALAHRIPVVSTSVGAHGLSITNGVHALIADDAAGFAEACVTLLTDDDLRQNLAAAGADHVRERFAQRVVMGHIQRLTEELLQSS